MNKSTDYLGLNNHKLFKKLNETCRRDVVKTQNVLTINDGVLYAWDFQDNCVLTLNLKRARCFEDNRVLHQILLPTSTSRFPVELLRVNAKNTLLVVAGSSGIMVLELPERCPPHGAFANNKEMVYCKSHNLDEQLLTCNPSIEVRQVRFHPASEANTHILVLTSDNALRLYNILNSSAVCLKVHGFGRRPVGVMPGGKSYILGLLGDTGVDFDFGPPELADDSENLEDETNPFSSNFEMSVEKKNHIKESKEKWNYLEWPVYVLYGNGSIIIAVIDINNKKPSKMKGDVPIWPEFGDGITHPFTSIICQQSTPPILCIATVNGTLYHGTLLPVEASNPKMSSWEESEFFEPPGCALYIFEALELELGMAVSESLRDYSCPVFLHADESRLGHYFATHEGGVHSINVPAIAALQQVVNGSDDDYRLDLVIKQPSSADYLLCTKTVPSTDINPVVGFGVYYDPTSIVTLLAHGQVVSSLAVYFSSLPSTEDLFPEDIENFNSPLKKMLDEPFDLHIQRILQQVTSHPILKLSGSGERSPQESYEVLQRTAQVFREEYFKNHEKAREEIQKRVKVLQMLKKYQTKELGKFTNEKQVLQEKAESLAEKYEDIKDKQDNLKKRCERMLVLVSQKKSESSEAEKNFLDELKVAQEKMKKYTVSIAKLKNQMKYQELQMENWKREQKRIDTGLGSAQSHALQTNLQDMTNQITDTINEVNEYKKKLALN